jgi:hypothetical protein
MAGYMAQYGYLHVYNFRVPRLRILVVVDVSRINWDSTASPGRQRHLPNCM